MAIYYDEDHGSFDEDGTPVAWGVLINWAGALVSLALIGGLAVWGYQLLVRDVTGVPVVRALEGPMRVAPDEPGGMQAEYQDLSVTRVASDGAEEAPVEQVVLAPPPVALTEEDQPMTALIEDTSSIAPAAAPAIVGDSADAGAAEVAATAADAPAPAVERPRSAIEAAIAEALADTGPAATEPQRVSAIAAGGLARSPRPEPRPYEVQNAVATSSDSDLALEGAEVAVSAIPAGTRLVQLGAYPTPAEAREAWGELDQKFGAYFEGKKRVVQEAAAGGSSFYRLRAMGFDDLADARRFCAVLVAENANCIPVIRR